MVTLKHALIKYNEGCVVFGIYFSEKLFALSIIILDYHIQLAFKDTQRENRQ